jgi:hypothetical protein
MFDFLCITFGPSEDVVHNGWWNRKQRFYTQEEAKQCGLKQLSQPGTFGYVVIEEGEDWWKVVDELGAPEHCVSVGCKNHNYVVQPAPKLTFV